MIAEEEEEEDDDEDEEDEDEELPIFQATARGDVNKVARLLDAEPHLLEAREGRRTDAKLLLLAAQRGHVGVVSLLLERGAEVNAPGRYGYTALHEAAWEGHEEVVNVLLSSGVDSSMKCRDGSTALMRASSRGDLGVVKQLLQHMQGRGLNERDIKGRSALWSACASSHLDVIRTLLLAGADPHVGPVPRMQAGRVSDMLALLEVSGACRWYREV
jgi:ankyrin repeat protein